MNRSVLVSSMLVRSLVWLYSTMVSGSSTGTLKSVFTSRPEDRPRKVGIASSNTFQVSHVDFLPFVPKDDTVSHPVYAWNIGRNRDLSGSRDVAISCAGMYLKCRPVPKATQSSWMSISTVAVTAKTTESVSTVRRITFL